MKTRAFTKYLEVAVPEAASAVTEDTVKIPDTRVVRRTLETVVAGGFVCCTTTQIYNAFADCAAFKIV